MATVDRIERRPTLGDHIRFVREHLPRDAELQMTEGGAVETADKLARHLRAITELMGGSENTAKLLLYLTDDIQEVPSGLDHHHRPLCQIGEKRKGPLVAVSHIDAHSNQNPEQHLHEDCLEFVIPVTPGMVSLMTIDGKEVRQPIAPLEVFRVEPGIKHSDYNESYDKELVYVIFRAKLIPPTPNHPYLKIQP